MKKKILIICLLAVFLLGSSAGQYAYKEYYVLDKRPEVEDGNSLFVIIFVQKSLNENETYEDYIKFKRLRVETDSYTYDLLRLHSTYLAEELKAMGIEFDAEQSEQAVLRDAKLRELKEKVDIDISMYRDIRQGLNLIEQIEELETYVKDIASEGEVSAQEMSDFNGRVGVLNRRSSEAGYAMGLDSYSKFKAENASKFRFLENSNNVLKIYYKGLRHKDNPEHKVEEFFKLAAGLESIKIEKEEDWSTRAKIGLLVGLVAGFILGVGIGFLLLILIDDENLALWVGIVLGYAIWIVFWFFIIG